MPVRATVLIPTFDHGPTLRYAVDSARRQTVAELEIFVVGDGAPQIARQIVTEIALDDSRLHFFDNPKGPRHGEIHRHAALAEASGEIVCYLSDDDLWLPEHVESMLALLAEGDFAHSLPMRVEPDGSVGGWAVDLANSSDRELLLAGENRIPLSCSGHTLDAYRRLPHGWRTTPEGPPTDLYMFQQFLREPWVRAASGTRPTCLHFPSPDRTGLAVEQRCAELARWAGRVRDADWRRSTWTQLALSEHTAGWALSDRNLRAAGAVCAATNQELEVTRRQALLLEEQLRVAHDEAADAGNQADAAARKLEEARARWDTARQELETLHATLRASISYRLGRRLLSLPILGRLLRSAATAPARREEP